MNTQNRQHLPRLSTIAPLTHWISVGFVWLNIWLAHVVWISKGTSLVIYEGPFSQKFWATTFLLLALGVSTGLLTNRWELVRRSMIAGLFVKAVFLYALVFLARTVGFSQVEGSIALWLFLVWVQVGAVIFFLPPIPTEHGNDR